MKSIVPWKKKENRNLARRRDPFSVLHGEIDDLFDQFTSGFFDESHWPSFGQAPEFPGLREPSVDISESDNAYEVTADLPGVSEDDLDVSVDENVITIKAEQSHEDERKEKNYHVMERSSGTYQRTIPLPNDVDAENIKAKFKNGVLSLNLPKNPQQVSNKRTIEIES